MHLRIVSVARWQCGNRATHEAQRANARVTFSAQGDRDATLAAPTGRGAMMTQESERLTPRARQNGSRPTLARKVFNLLTAALVLTLVGVAVLIFVLTRPR
jgi:hypothetical protein